MPYLGEIAALGTAVSWAAGTLFLTSASQQTGSFTMNNYRVLFGTLQVILLYILWTQTCFPTDLAVSDWILLSLSGICGFFLCDALLFQSYVDLSPRIGVSIFNIYPFIATLLAWIFLQETLPLSVWLGMAVTMVGVGIIVLEKSGNPLHIHKHHYMRGIILASAAATFQAIGLVIVKPIMWGEGGVDPLSATLVRVLAGAVPYWLVTVCRGRVAHVIQMARNRKIMLTIFGGTILGTPVGVTLSMVAIKYAPIGIASTLMALMPLTILPLTVVLYKEKLSYRAVIGAIVTCLGVALLFNT